MLKFLSYQTPELPLTATIDELTYKSSNIFPDWITSNLEWKGVKKAASGSVVDVLSRYVRVNKMCTTEYGGWTTLCV